MRTHPLSPDFSSFFFSLVQLESLFSLPQGTWSRFNRVQRTFRDLMISESFFNLDQKSRSEHTKLACASMKDTDLHHLLLQLHPSQPLACGLLPGTWDCTCSQPRQTPPGGDSPRCCYRGRHTLQRGPQYSAVLGAQRRS